MSFRSWARRVAGVLAATVLAVGAADARDNVLRVAWGTAGDEVLATASSFPAVLTGRILLDNPVPSGPASRLFFKFIALDADVTGMQRALGNVVEIAPTNWEIAPPAPFDLPAGLTTEIATFTVVVADSARVDLFLHSGLLTDAGGENHMLFTQFGEINAAWVNAGEPQLAISPLLFAPRGINREPVTGYRVVVNAGSGPFFFDTAVLGAPCGPFRVSNAGGTYLLSIMPGGRAKSVYVEFAPSAVGDFACQLPLGGGEYLPVQGTGRTPIHALTANPTALDFGEVAVGGLGQVTFEVTNSGDFVESHAGVVTGDGTPLVAEPIVDLPPDQTRSHDLTYAAPDYDRHDWQVSYGGLVTVGATAIGIDGFLSAFTYPDTLRLAAPIGQTSYAGTFSIINNGTMSFTPALEWVGDASHFAVAGDEPSLIQPGQSDLVAITYTAPDATPRLVGLRLGAGLPEMPVIGRGLVDHPALAVWPTPLVLPPAAVGDTVTGVFAMQNTGNSWISLELIPTDPRLQIIGGTNGLNPGGFATITVRYVATDYRQLDARLVVDHELGVEVNVVGPPVFPFGPDENRLSVFFDESFTAPETTVPPAPQVLPAWLVLRNPSEAGGVAGWSCRLETSAGAMLTNAVPSGTVFDAAAAMDEFSVTVSGSPLPPAAAVVLAQLQVLVLDPALTEATLSARGLVGSPVPGLPTWTPGGGASPLAMAAAPGALTVGTIHLRDPAGAVDDPLPNRPVARLLPNVPNPFNPRTEIRCELAVAGPVTVRVYDVQGRLVRELAAQEFPAGRHAVVWDGRDRHGRAAASGTYYVRLVAGGRVDGRKILLLK